MDFAQSRRAEREKHYGKFGICNCGNCESAVPRALAFIGKMLDDRECYQFAINATMGLILQRLIGHEVEGQAPKKLGPLGPVFAPALTEIVLSDIVETVAKWMLENEELVNNTMNVHIERNNKRLEEEQKLPKGD